MYRGCDIFLVCYLIVVVIVCYRVYRVCHRVSFLLCYVVFVDVDVDVWDVWDVCMCGCVDVWMC